VFIYRKVSFTPDYVNHNLFLVVELATTASESGRTELPNLFLVELATTASESGRTE